MTGTAYHGRHRHELDLLTSEMRDLLALYQQGAIQPYVDSTWPFSQAAEAWKRIELGQNKGKVLLIPD